MLQRHVKLIGLIGVSFISIVDYLIVVDISLSILYLLPISLTSWYGNRRFSIFLVLVSTAAWFVAEFSAKADMYLLILLWNTLVRLVVFLTVSYLISNLKSAYEREKNLSQTDGLTAIVNRRFFLETLSLEYKRSLRYERCLTLVYFDVDNFKQVNDRFGHNTGDKLLVTIAQTIKKQIRETDTIARLGGDEFALLLPETDYKAGQYILSRLQQKLAIAIEAYSPPVSFSIGAVTFLSLPDSIKRMLDEADSLMYRVKKSGKNRLEHQVFQATDSRSIIKNTCQN